jgi:single-strand DNA-binding protein
MNKIIIIGNLVRDPELRTTPSGVAVCTFTIAVNGRKPEDTQFFRITTWRQTAENCQRFLTKGRKVAVTGAVSLNTYTAKDGTTKASLEVNADEVEFLTPRTADAPPAPEQTDAKAGFVKVDDEPLPF